LASASAWLAKKSFQPNRCGDALNRLLKEGYIPLDSYQGRREDRAALHRLASSLITRFMDGLLLISTGRMREVEDRRYELEMWKQLTWYYVIHKPSLATVQRGERQVIRTLFGLLSTWASQAQSDEWELSRLPVQFRQALESVQADWEGITVLANDEELRLRATVDYVASLTETQAIKLYQRLAGGLVEGSALEVWREFRGETASMP
jgi:dGTPase